MSLNYDLKEHSIADSKPVRLYDFRLGSLVIAYADGDRAIRHQGIDYRAVAISDSGISQGYQDRGLTVTLPGDTELARLYAGPPPTQTVTLTVRELQYDLGESEVVWVGSVGSVGRGKDGAAQVNCRSVLAALELTGLRMSWGRRCPYVLFDARCKLDRNAWAARATLAEINAGRIAALELEPFPAQWFRAGYIEWATDYGLERRYIESHSGTWLQLLGGTHGLQPGLSFVAYPGCDYTASACAALGNLDNCGAVPGLPSKNPYKGQPIF